jgi:hypothetical protein
MQDPYGDLMFSGVGSSFGGVLTASTFFSKTYRSYDVTMSMCCIGGVISASKSYSGVDVLIIIRT